MKPPVTLREKLTAIKSTVASGFAKQVRKKSARPTVKVSALKALAGVAEAAELVEFLSFTIESSNGNHLREKALALVREALGVAGARDAAMLRAALERYGYEPESEATVENDEKTTYNPPDQPRITGEKDVGHVQGPLHDYEAISSDNATVRRWALLGLPETPARMWTPRRAGRPPKGASYNDELIAFIREVYGDNLKGKSSDDRRQVRSYIYNKDEVLYEAIIRLERYGGKLPPEIDMPSAPRLLEERFQKAMRNGLYAMPKPVRRAVSDKLGRIARQEQAPKG